MVGHVDAVSARSRRLEICRGAMCRDLEIIAHPHLAVSFVIRDARGCFAVVDRIRVTVVRGREPSVPDAGCAPSGAAAARSARLRSRDRCRSRSRRSRCRSKDLQGVDHDLRRLARFSPPHRSWEIDDAHAPAAGALPRAMMTTSRGRDGAVRPGPSLSAPGADAGSRTRGLLAALAIHARIRARR
jgi:hypothetical protein